MPPKRVGILIFDDVEVLDFAGPFEVFAMVRENPEDNAPDAPRAFQVDTVAQRPGPVRCRGGLRVAPTHTTAACPTLDVLVVPGGWGTRREVGNSTLIDWIRERAGEAELVASVCTGAFLLAEAGLLDGLAATTHWRNIGRLREAYPSVLVREGTRFVDEGRVMTAAGVAAGIDMALHAVARLRGEDFARATARDMEYPYAEGL